MRAFPGVLVVALAAVLGAACAPALTEGAVEAGAPTAVTPTAVTPTAVTPTADVPRDRSAVPAPLDQLRKASENEGTRPTGSGGWSARPAPRRRPGDDLGTASGTDPADVVTLFPLPFATAPLAHVPAGPLAAPLARALQRAVDRAAAPRTTEGIAGALRRRHQRRRHLGAGSLERRVGHRGRRRRADPAARVRRRAADPTRGCRPGGAARRGRCPRPGRPGP